MLLHGLASTRKTVFIYLILHYLRLISQQYRTSWLTGRHLWFLALHCWKEACIETSCFLVLQFLREISGHSKVWILINGTGNQALYILLSKNVWKCIWEWWNGLNRWVSKFANTLAVIKSKDALNLIKRDMLLYPQNVRIHSLNILRITEYEGLLWVESKSNYVFYVTMSHLTRFLPPLVFFKQVLFVIRHLNYDR